VLAQAVRETERMPGGAELAELLVERCGIHANPRSILRRLLPYLKQQEKKRLRSPKQLRSILRGT
jgi:hypothetical protein